MNANEFVSWYDTTKVYARLFLVSVKVLTRTERFPSCKCFSFCDVLKFKSHAIDKKSDNEEVEKPKGEKGKFAIVNLKIQK